MPEAFKRVRKPDSASMSMSLEEHIADTSSNPHSQYVRKTDLVNVQSGITTVESREGLEAYSQIQTTHAVPNAYVGYLISTALSAVEDKMSRHEERINQSIIVAPTDEQLSMLPHRDTDGYSLYAARLHHHTLGEIGEGGAAAAIHEHEEYSLVGHTHNYANVTHFHPEYVDRLDLSSVGIYPEAVNVAKNIQTDIEIEDPESGDGNTPVEQPEYFDCDDFLSQGNFYLKPTGEDSVKHGPLGEEYGLLKVYTTSSDDGNDIDIMQFFYGGEISWKRTGKSVTTTEEVTEEIVDPDTGETTTITNEVPVTTKTFTDWMPVVETSPIGSLMFSNNVNIPQGYLEANGAAVSSVAYPALWRYVSNYATLVLSTDPNYMSGYLHGCYALVMDSDETVASKELTAEDVDNVWVIDTNGYLHKLTENNSATYVGQVFSYIPAERMNRQDLMFRLPKLGGNFLRMWTASQDTDLGRIMGTHQESAAPNITGDPGRIVYVNNTDGSVSKSLYLADGKGVGGVAAYVGGLYHASMQFNASKSSSVYKSTVSEVRPDNIAMRVFIKAYNGSLLKTDVGETTIRDIIAGLVSQYAYATANTAGLVKLATIGQIEGGTTPDTAVTPLLLQEATKNYISEIEQNGMVHEVHNHRVVLADTADRYGNKAVSLQDQSVTDVEQNGETISVITPNAIKCTAIVDIATAENTYKDFVIPVHIAEELYNDSIGGYDIDSATIDIVLKCTNASNALGYPVGSVIPQPLCSYKPNNESEYMTHPTATVFVDTADKYENTEQPKLKVRLYWPLMWYLKRFTPAIDDGSKTFPFTAVPDPTDDMIESECAYWTVILNLHI